MFLTIDELEQLIGAKVYCSGLYADPATIYTLLEVNRRSGGAKIQAEKHARGHWVNACNIRRIPETTAKERT